MNLGLEYLGRGLSFWPPYDDRGHLNLVAGERKIAHDIISVLLIQPGEVPHYALGIAPELFDPLSRSEAQYWAYNAQREILQWVVGIESLTVEIPHDRLDAENQLIAEIDFVPKTIAPGGKDRDIAKYSAIGRQNLLFSWSSYVEGLADTSLLNDFFLTVELNREPLF